MIYLKKIIFTCLLVSFSNVSNSQKGNTSITYKIHVNEAKEYLRKLEKNSFSGQVFLKHNGKIFTKGYGFSNRENNIFNNENTVFDIGSITKYYTKAAIIKLVELGKLNLDDNLKSIFKNVPSDKADITILQLLEMSSGLVDYVPGGKVEFDFMSKEKARREVFEAELLFPPGSKKKYSNSGYIVLAMIIEDKSGISYPKFLNKYIFPKEVSKHGFYNESFWNDEQVAYGYDMLSYGDKNSPLHWPKLSWNLMGSGGIVTSAKGLYEWLEAMKNGKILNRKSLAVFDELQTKRVTPRGTKSFVRAGGSMYGFTTVVADYPEEDLFVALISNTAKYDIPSNVIKEFSGILLGVSNDNAKSKNQTSPKEARLNEFLKILKEGDLKSYIEKNFEKEFLNAYGVDQHLGLLASMREKYGTFRILEILEKRQGYLKILVEGIKTNEKRVLILAFETSPPYKISLIGLEMHEANNSVNENQSLILDTPALKKLSELVDAINGNENELKKFIEETFEKSFLDNHGGVEGHYNFFNNFMSGGIKILEVKESQKNKATVHVKDLKMGHVIETSITISDDGKKILSLGFVPL